MYICIQTGNRGFLVVKRIRTGGDESFIDAVPWINLRRRRGNMWLLPGATVDSLKLKAHRTRVWTSEGVARTVRCHVIRMANPRDETVGSVANVSWCWRSDGSCEKENNEEEERSRPDGLGKSATLLWCEERVVSKVRRFLGEVEVVNLIERGF